ncbi:hypothetical protein SAMN05216553_1196 [Lentzea fradiae]|uniref:NB-ARC domain-containing protein n=1 Tax=Lentzea fradiae TaxID=200378 RepID=A0A1G8BD38_9PSEU|nr:ATP-binding protein [Lentzea fradiae]SDH30943.1 hypothetical protein SAMN05216553_1196 [Lentzea fradiae]
MTGDLPASDTANSNTGPVYGAIVQAGSVHGIVVVNGSRSREFVSVDFSGVPDLIGREGDLAALSDVFTGRPSKPIVRVLTGESGVGKSALAAAYGCAHQDRYGSMLWIGGREPDEQCRNLLNVLAPGESAVVNPVDVLHGVLATKNDRWLLVLDDVSPLDVRRLVPAAGPGDVIITSPTAVWRPHPVIEVKPLDLGASADLLLDVAEGLPEHAARAVAAVVCGSPRSLLRACEHLVTNRAVDWMSYLRLHVKGAADFPSVSGMARRSTIAAGAVRDGHPVLFAIDRHGRLVRRWDDSGWWPMDEPEPLHRVASSSLGPGHLEVFGVTGGQGLVHRWYEGEPGRWQPWRVMATPDQVSWIAGGSPRDGEQNLFAVTVEGGIFSRCFPDGELRQWSPWREIRVPEPISAVAWAGMNRTTGHQELFAATASGNLLHRWYRAGGVWSDWSSMDVPGHVRTLTAGSHQQSRQHVIVAVDSSAVLALYYGRHGWEPEWTALPGDEAVVALTCSSPASGRLELFGTSTSGTLLSRSYRHGDGWSAWEPFER